MSRFESKFESIESLRFSPVPRTPIAVVKAVSYDRTTAMLGVDGRIYTDAVQENVCYTNTTGRHADLFRCCKKLRVLSSNVIQQHIALEAKRNEKSHRQWAARQMSGAAKDLGLALTKAQAAAVKALLGDE